MKPNRTFPLFAMAMSIAAAALSAELSLESAPPVVVKTVPAAGATGVDPSLAEIQVTYSKAMTDRSWSWSTWGPENYPETTGEPRYAADRRTCVLPVKLQPGRFYAIWLNSAQFKGFQDTAGNPAVPYLLSFQTAGDAPTLTANRKFVRVVVQDDGMTFQGEPASWDRLDGLLQAVSDRASTVLEWAITSNQIPREQQNAWAIRFGELARRHGFEYASFVGVHPLGSKGGERPRDEEASRNVAASAATADDSRLNPDQRAVLAWTDRQFRSYFDQRTFAGWSDRERADLETRLVDALKGPETREYYQAINTLGALGGSNAVTELRRIAFDRRDKNNRDRWMAIRALGILGDKAAIPDLIPLVYHGNANTHWWAQISLVRLTGQNFGSDWNAWGKWWNASGGQPPYNAEIIRWWNGQPEPDQLAQSLAEGDAKFLSSLQPSATAATTSTPPSANPAKPVAFQAPDPEPVSGLTNAVALHHDTGIRTGMESINGSGHAVQFTRPAGASYVEAVQIFASRYGSQVAPAEDFHLYVLNDQQQVLADVPFPYAMVERGDMKWYTLRTPSIEVPDKFHVALAFNPHRTKGIYLAFTETNDAACHSLIGLPGDGFESWKPCEWMVRVSLTAEPTKEKGLQRLADWKPVVAPDPFAGCRMAAFGGERSEDKQSYGGRGPAIRFKPTELLTDLRPNEPVRLKGIRLSASRYGGGYPPEQTFLRVLVLDGQGATLGEGVFASALFGNRAKWVDLVFENPIAIASPAEELTVAFDPSATQTKGIYFHFQKNPAVSHSLAGTVRNGFTATPDREWLMRVAFEAPTPASPR